MLKKQKIEGELCSHFELKAIFEKAIYTLEIIMQSLLQMRVFY